MPIASVVVVVVVVVTVSVVVAVVVVLTIFAEVPCLSKRKTKLAAVWLAHECRRLDTLQKKSEK